MTTFLSWVRNFGHFLLSLARSAWRSIQRWTVQRWIAVLAAVIALLAVLYFYDLPDVAHPVSYTHLTLPTNREV